MRIRPLGERCGRQGSWPACARRLFWTWFGWHLHLCACDHGGRLCLPPFPALPRFYGRVSTAWWTGSRPINYRAVDLRESVAREWDPCGLMGGYAGAPVRLCRRRFSVVHGWRIGSTKWNRPVRQVSRSDDAFTKVVHVRPVMYCHAAMCTEQCGARVREFGLARCGLKVDRTRSELRR